MSVTRSLGERFWEKVNIADPNECWEWNAYRTHDGYGVITVNGATQLAHRVAWMLSYGPIPEDLCSCHKCDNPPCCNPAHLFLSTQKGNVHDMLRKGRESHAVGCPGEKHPQSKLTEEQVIEIRALYRRGICQRRMAEQFGVSESSIHKIIQGGNWKHLPFDGGHTVKKQLTKEQVIEIRSLYTSTNISQRELFSLFCVSPQTICNIVRQKSWEHLI